MLKFFKHSIACIALFSFWHAVNAFEYVGGAQSGFGQSQESCETQVGLEQHMLSSVEHNNIDFSSMDESEDFYDQSEDEFYEEGVFNEFESSVSLESSGQEQASEQLIESQEQSVNKNNTESKEPQAKPEFIEWMLQKHKLPSLHFLDVLEIIDN
jgi:hypothetical protein